MTGTLALVLALLAAGVLLRRAGLAGEGDADALQRFVINVCVPATVLHVVPHLDFDSRLLWPLVAPWALAAGTALLVLGYARVAALPRPETGALLLCVPLGNTSFLGFPMVEALIGAEGVRHAVVYDQLGSFLLLSTYGVMVAARFGGSAPPDARALLGRIARFPPFLALLLALLPLPVPPAADLVLSRVSAALVPAALLGVGLRLELGRPERSGALAFGLAAKLGLGPAALLACAVAAGAHGESLRVTLLESGMPPMISAGALAVTAGLAPGLAAALVGWGLLAALGTLPLLARLGAAWL